MLGGVHACVRSVVCGSAAPWTEALGAPLSVGFSRPEDWGALPFPSPGDLPDPGSKPCLQHRESQGQE